MNQISHLQASVAPTDLFCQIFEYLKILKHYFHLKSGNQKHILRHFNPNELSMNDILIGVDMVKWMWRIIRQALICFLVSETFLWLILHCASVKYLYSEYYGWTLCLLLSPWLIVWTKLNTWTDYLWKCIKDGVWGWRRYSMSHGIWWNE